MNNLTERVAELILEELVVAYPERATGFATERVQALTQQRDSLRPINGGGPSDALINAAKTVRDQVQQLIAEAD